MRKDLQLHIVVGVIIAAALSAFGLSFLESWIAATWVGILKEVVWDLLLDKGTPDPLDAVATSGGGILGAFPFLL